MRTVLLGLVGLAVAVAVGLGVHLITRSTISLPVVQLEQPPPVPPRTTTRLRITTTTVRETTTPERQTTTVERETAPQAETKTDDSSGSGRNHGRSGGDSGGNSGSGGGDD